MEKLLPHSFLFRFSLACPYWADMPSDQGLTPTLFPTGAEGRVRGLTGLPPESALPDLSSLDGAASFAELRLGWNERGLGFVLRVSGKTAPLRCEPQYPMESDGLHLWIDTRDTRSIHRATRFCHHFYFLPTGARREAKSPWAGQRRIHRAREDARLVKSGEIEVAAAERSGGYVLEGFLPADVLTGYDPSENPRLGFYYLVRDAELGDQALTAAREFPFEEDPSLWATLELVGPSGKAI